MAYIRVMRRKDAPHVYHQFSKAMQARTDVLEPAWLNTETLQTSLQPPEEPKPQPPRPAAKRVAKKRGISKNAVSDAELDAAIAGLGD